MNIDEQIEAGKKIEEKERIKEQIKKGKKIHANEGENIEKVPFVNYTLDEEKEDDKYGRPISVRLNQEEKLWLEEIKEDFNIKSDGKALKIAAFAGKNVLQVLLGRKILRYLFKKERQKLEDFKNF